MKAPQVIYIVLVLLGLIWSAVKHGDEKTGTHSFPIEFVGSLLGFLLLLWGGFFR